MHEPYLFATMDSKIHMVMFQEECKEQLENLLESLRASMVVVSEANEEVKALVPGAKEIEVWVDLRKNDAIFARSLGRYLLRVCKKYLMPLVGEHICFHDHKICLSIIA